MESKGGGDIGEREYLSTVFSFYLKEGNSRIGQNYHNITCSVSCHKLKIIKFVFK